MTTLAPTPTSGPAATDAAPARRITSVNPATGEVNGSVPVATPAEVDAAVRRARGAAQAWRRTSPSERGAALKAAAAAVRADRERLAQLHLRDTGRLLSDCLGAVDVAADLLVEAATLAPLDAGRSLGGATGAIDLTRREPRGVVAVITPWNDPLPAAAGLLGAALATGNTVVHKPSERAALVGQAFGEAVAAHLPDGRARRPVRGRRDRRGAGRPPRRRRRRARRLDPRRGGGSPRSAGPRAAKLLLENGGKDVMVVDRDVDPVWAAGQAALGAFVNAGQLCVAVERVVVHADVADAFLAALVEEAHRWAPGRPRRPRDPGSGPWSTSAPWTASWPTSGPPPTRAPGC
jgi:succinate-semialdehyde dehydrogenase/glutarate-semialdehyde dehydrogenase